MSAFDDAPDELQEGVQEFWPESQWDNAVNIAALESGWSAFAENDTTNALVPCGTPLFNRDGVQVTAEHSVGWFQINACNLPPDWKWYHLFNTRHNCGTAHAMWDAAGGWYPWYFSALQLGLIPIPMEFNAATYANVRHVRPNIAALAIKWHYNPRVGLVVPRPELQAAPPSPP